jgi:hypothetical protein
LVATGAVNSTNLPVPCKVTALRYEASAGRVPYVALGPMIVPLVLEFSACTSTYGRVAPTPPVAAAAAGSAASAMRTEAPMAIRAMGPAFNFDANMSCSLSMWARCARRPRGAAVPRSSGRDGGTVLEAT